MRVTKMRDLERSLGTPVKIVNDKVAKKVNQGNDKFNLHGYAEFYDKHLPEDPKVIVEMGVLGGHSMYIWKQLFPDARVIGLDINPELCEWPEFEVYEFDEWNPDLELLESFGPIDVFIDDALHDIESQTMAYTRYSPYVEGVYFVEDIDKGKTLPFLTEQEGRIGVVLCDGSLLL